ncbi:beta-galactoside alpha-2,3-sialyltransferase 1 [Pycnococcus provasolii]
MTSPLTSPPMRRLLRRLPTERTALLLFAFTTLLTRTYVAHRPAHTRRLLINDDDEPSPLPPPPPPGPLAAPPRLKIITKHLPPPPPPPVPILAPPPVAVPAAARGLHDGWLDVPLPLLATPPPPPPESTGDDAYSILQAALSYGGSNAQTKKDDPNAFTTHLPNKFTLTRHSVEDEGALYIPKIDNSRERVFPDPGVRLYGKPYATNHELRRKWDLARRNTGVTWRRLLHSLPSSDELASYRPATCAVVGNGGTLKVHADEGYGFGAAIDAHECVIRFNFAPAGGVHARVVGNRTSIRILNRARVLELDQQVDEELARSNNADPSEVARKVVRRLSQAEIATLGHVTAPDALEAFVRVRLGDRGVGQRPRHGIGGGAEQMARFGGSQQQQGQGHRRRHRLLLRRLLQQVAPSSARNASISAIDPTFHAHVLHLYRELLATARSIPISADSPATSGFYGVILALAICKRVTVYGFARHWGAANPTLGVGTLHVPYHYFDAEEPNVGQKQRDDTELISLSALEKRVSGAQQGAMHGDSPMRRLRHGEPCSSPCELTNGADQCDSCMPGSTCVCNVWHSVPKPGYCYDLATMSNIEGAVGRLNCFRPCVGGESMCPGGVDGSCMDVRMKHGASALGACASP